MSTATDYGKLLVGLDSCRWEQMRVLADAAEDNGDPVLAAGWRWLADNRKWPGADALGEGETFYWRAVRHEDQSSYGPDVLPWGAFQRLPVRATNPRARTALLLKYMARPDPEAPEDFYNAVPLCLPEALEMTARAVGEWLAEGGERDG
jgi:hypothetical protein